MAQILWFPAIVIAAALLSRRWPRPMRRASRCLAIVNGLAFLCIIATGLLPRTVPVAAIHKWLSHGLFTLDWNAIPLAIGETLVRSRTRPIAAARASGLLMLLFVLFLASITGYDVVGPKQVKRGNEPILDFKQTRCCDGSQ